MMRVGCRAGGAGAAGLGGGRRADLAMDCCTSDAESGVTLLPTSLGH